MNFNGFLIRPIWEQYLKRLIWTKVSSWGYSWIMLDSMLRMIRFIIALGVCLIALLLPYRARLLWYQLMAWLVHLPFRIFGALARFIINKTKTDNPYEE